VQLDGIESEGEIRFDGISLSLLQGSRVAGSIVVKDSSSPELIRNFVDGDIDFASTGTLKMDGNAVRGALMLRGAPPVDLLDRNLFSSGKKAIRVLHE
jgi:hypothetical protein